jgi:mRNA interferase RelE/StbE
MIYEIVIDKKASKYLEKLPKNFRKLIKKEIDDLAFNLRPFGCKSLHGQLKGLFRVRVGDFRIIYEIIDDKLIILVLIIAPRGSIYD